MAFSVPAVAVNYMLLTSRQSSKTDRFIATDFFIIMSIAKIYVIGVTYTTAT